MHLSTGPGVSGVAIIRISGPEVSKVIKKLTGKKFLLQEWLPFEK
jgi:tRNA modification GTPase